MAIAAAADIACILVFVALGRRNHDEGETVDGVLTVAAPFLIALVVGWIVARAWTRPMEVEAAFIIVATIVTGVFLVGWRLVAARFSRSR